MSDKDESMEQKVGSAAERRDFEVACEMCYQDICLYIDQHHRHYGRRPHEILVSHTEAAMVSFHLKKLRDRYKYRHATADPPGCVLVMDTILRPKGSDPLTSWRMLFRAESVRGRE